MLSIVILNVIILSVVLLYFVMFSAHSDKCRHISVVMPKVVILLICWVNIINNIMLSVVILRVIAPFKSVSVYTPNLT